MHLIADHDHDRANCKFLEKLDSRKLEVECCLRLRAELPFLAVVGWLIKSLSERRRLPRCQAFDKLLISFCSSPYSPCTARVRARVSHLDGGAQSAGRGQRRRTVSHDVDRALEQPADAASCLRSPAARAASRAPLRARLSLRRHALFSTGTGVRQAHSRTHSPRHRMSTRSSLTLCRSQGTGPRSGLAAVSRCRLLAVRLGAPVD